MTIAAPTAVALEAASAMTRFGSLPTRLRRAVITAEAAHATSIACSVLVFEATKTGVSRYRTTTATIDHAACATAHAAAGAVTPVRVIHAVNGHSAIRPATPTKSSAEPTTIERSVQPGFVCRIGTSVVRLWAPYRA